MMPAAPRDPDWLVGKLGLTLTEWSYVSWSLRLTPHPRTHVNIIIICSRWPEENAIQRP